MSKLLSLILIYFLLSNVLYANEICAGIERTADDVRKATKDGTIFKNRFSHCKKGDVIGVYVSTFLLSENQKRRIENLYETKSFAMSLNEVSSYCSFDAPIVHVGDTETVHHSIKWFNCIYIGEDREYKTYPLN